MNGSKSGAPPPTSASSSRSQSLSARKVPPPKTITDIISVVNSALQTLAEVSGPAKRPSITTEEYPIVREQNLSLSDMIQSPKSARVPRTNSQSLLETTPPSGVKAEVERYYQEKEKGGIGALLSPVSSMSLTAATIAGAQKSSAAPSFLSQAAVPNVQTVSTAVGSDEPLFDSKGEVIESIGALPAHEQPWRLKEVLARVTQLWRKAEDDKITAEVRYTNLRDKYWQQQSQHARHSESEHRTTDPQGYYDASAPSIPYPSALSVSHEQMDYYQYYMQQPDKTLANQVIDQMRAAGDPRVGS